MRRAGILRRPVDRPAHRNHLPAARRRLQELVAHRNHFAMLARRNIGKKTLEQCREHLAHVLQVRRADFLRVNAQKAPEQQLYDNQYPPVHAPPVYYQYQPEEPQQPYQHPEEPQEAYQQPEEPQQPYQQPEEPQQPYQQPEEPQQPYQQPEQPQQPYQQPEEPQQPYHYQYEPQEPQAQEIQMNEPYHYQDHDYGYQYQPEDVQMMDLDQQAYHYQPEEPQDHEILMDYQYQEEDVQMAVLQNQYEPEGPRDHEGAPMRMPQYQQEEDVQMNVLQNQYEPEGPRDHEGIQMEMLEKPAKKRGKRAKDLLPTEVDYQNLDLQYYDQKTGIVDTKNLAKIILATLKIREISQEKFAKFVVHRSQGTLSDLLKNPKPWDKMKGGRDTYQQMISWLELSADKQQMVLEGQIPEGWVQSKSMGKKVTRKRVFVFSDEEKEILTAYADRFGSKPSAEGLLVLAEQMGIANVETIRNWFCNRRRQMINQ